MQVEGCLGDSVAAAAMAGGAATPRCRQRFRAFNTPNLGMDLHLHISIRCAARVLVVILDK